MIIKKLVVANGQYTAPDGTEKTRWLTIGALHRHEDKTYITLDRHINLAGLETRDGDTRVFANLFDPEPRGPAPQRASLAPSREEKMPFDDSIPF